MTLRAVSRAVHVTWPRAGVQGGTCHVALRAVSSGSGERHGTQHGRLQANRRKLLCKQSHRCVDHREAVTMADLKRQHPPWRMHPHVPATWHTGGQVGRGLTGQVGRGLSGAGREGSKCCHGRWGRSMHVRTPTYPANRAAAATWQVSRAFRMPRALMRGAATWKRGTCHVAVRG